MGSAKKIIRAALEARSPEDADRVQRMIEAGIGSRMERPIGDRWNNLGPMTASGASYDHKVIELATNMQDAVVELEAFRKHGGDVPYRTPSEAGEDLVAELGERALAERSRIEVHSAGGKAEKQRVTLVFRDGGCGLTREAIPTTIFALGSTHKQGVPWLQGTFGMGGITTYRNAKAVVLVTRRDPSLLLPGEEDRITVAVVQRDTESASSVYLVTTLFDDAAPKASGFPYSVPASEFPDFEPGTHLALISYHTEGFFRARSGDEKSLFTVLSTRLFRPTLPMLYANLAVRDKEEVVRGLHRRFEDNPREDRREGEEVLPINLDGVTYRLPIRFWVFSKPGEAGERRNFVARNHAVLLTVNGQVHKHWTPVEFRTKTTLNKLYDRILVEVEVDALPERLMRSLFTPDRSDTVRTEHGIRLEHEVASFLDDWGELRDINNELIREAIRGSDESRPTISIAEKIARAMKVKGFSLSGVGGGRGGSGNKIPAPPEELYADPTTIEGPASVRAEVGTSKGVYYTINALDGFVPNRAQLSVNCNHPDLNGSEISVGRLHKGRLRVSIAVPDGATLGTYRLQVAIDHWLKTSGGRGSRLEWDTELQVVDDTPRKPSGKSPRAGKSKGDRGADEGGLVAVIWKSHETESAWGALTVGEIDLVEGKVLAAAREEYADLAKYDGKVPTISLNREFRPLKDYVAARAKDLTDEGRERLRDRYAVGAGVGLLELDDKVAKRAKKGESISDEWLSEAQVAAARAVLSIMPEYDSLAREAGIDGI